MKLLTRELEALKETGTQTAESLQTAEMFDLRLEKGNQFNNFVAVKDAWYCTILIMIEINCFSQTLQLHNTLNLFFFTYSYFSNSLGWCLWINWSSNIYCYNRKRSPFVWNICCVAWVQVNFATFFLDVTCLTLKTKFYLRSSNGSMVPSAFTAKRSTSSKQ